MIDATRKRLEKQAEETRANLAEKFDALPAAEFVFINPDGSESEDRYVVSVDGILTVEQNFIMQSDGDPAVIRSSGAFMTRVRVTRVRADGRWHQ